MEKKIHQIEKEDAISILKDSFPGNFPRIKIIPITGGETESITHSLQPKKSSCYDEIMSKILKACTSLISHPLIFLYNLSLHQIHRCFYSLS